MQKVESLKKLLESSENLPTLPGIALRLLESVQKSEPSINEIGDILSTDPPLSAKILKIINSSLFSIPANITSVHHAIKMLGINSVKNLALSFSLVNKFNSMGSKTFDHSRFWKDSLIGAISTKLLGENIFPALAEDVFFLGLLQDIGILTLSHCMPKQFDLVKRESEKHGSQAHNIESRILGFNHMEVGEYLIKSWGLPDSFYIPIGHHHYPEKLNNTSETVNTLANILHITSLYIELFKSESDMELKLAAIENQIKAYDFDKVVDIHEIGLAINHRASDIFPIFEIDFEDQNDFIRLLENARAELINNSVGLIGTVIGQRQEIGLLKEQVGRDSMTNLINHQHFWELLHQEISRSNRYKSPLSLIFADIDHFKSINDKFGHLAGDHVIKTIAACLERELRESDLIARYGGEEFAIILVETGKKGGCIVAERLRKAISALKIVHGDSYIQPKMSFGIASIDKGVKISSDELIRRADSALYQAKEMGRNRCCVF